MRISPRFSRIELSLGRVTSHSLKQPQRPDLEVYVAALEKAVAETEVRSERWRQEADAAVKRVASLEANVAALQEAITEAEAIAEHRRLMISECRTCDVGSSLRFNVDANHCHWMLWSGGWPWLSWQLARCEPNCAKRKACGSGFELLYLWLFG